jgi:rubrerythrin
VDGAIRKRDILSHPVVTIQSFGWKVLVRSLMARPGQTFLSIVAPTLLPNAVDEKSEFVARAISLELRAMRIYRCLAERFSHLGKLHDFFVNLARAEEDHAELLELCFASSDRQAWTKRSLEPWRDTVAHLEDQMQRFQLRAYHILSVPGALRLVIAIESSEIDDVFDAIVEASDSRFAQVVEAFQSAGDAHTEVICRTISELAPELIELCSALRESHRYALEPTLDRS